MYHPSPLVVKTIYSFLTLLTGEEYSWEESQQILSNSVKLNKLISDFDIEEIDEERLKLLEKYFHNPDYNIFK